MATPITPTDIQTLMGRTLTSEELDAAALYIEFAESEIEAYLGRPIKPTAFEENCFPDNAGTVYFKNSPVISVESVLVNNNVQQVDGFTVTTYGLENIWDLSWDYLAFDSDHVDTDHIYGGRLVVAYTAGLDYPGAIRSLVAAAVMRSLRSTVSNTERETVGALGVKTIQAEDFLITYESPFASSVTSTSQGMFNADIDFKGIRRFKRIGVA